MEGNVMHRCNKPKNYKKWKKNKQKIEKSHLNATHERQMIASWKGNYFRPTAAVFSPHKHNNSCFCS